ncbi:MAG: CPBP family glutamic-type intramembrane protease [Chthonomonadales bacterium]
MYSEDPSSVAEAKTGGGGHHAAGQSLATLLVGSGVIAWLTHYNLQQRSVWSPPSSPIPYSWDEYLVVNTTLLALPALLLILAGFKQSPWAFGLRPPEARTARVVWFFYILMLPVLWLAAHRPDFQAQYPLFHSAANSWAALAAYEITYGFYLFCWEFFYRGFLTFGIARGWGSTAGVVLQAVGFGLMHLGKPTPEFLSSFPGGLIMGWLALRTRSFLPGFALHWAISATLDLLVIAVRHAGLIHIG